MSEAGDLDICCYILITGLLAFLGYWFLLTRNPEAQTDDTEQLAAPDHKPGPQYGVPDHKPGPQLRVPDHKPGPQFGVPGPQFNFQAATRIVAIDFEHVVCRDRSGRNKNVAVQCAIVDYSGDRIYNKWICPHLPVLDWKGFERERVEEEGMPFEEAKKQILHVLAGNIVVVHNREHDFGYLDIQNDIPHAKVRDTATCLILYRKAGLRRPFHKQQYYVHLKDLAVNILNIQYFQTKTPHDPEYDAQVTMQLYRVVENEWEKEYKEDLTTHIHSQTVKIAN